MTDLITTQPAGDLAPSGVVTETAQFIAFLERAARDPNVDVGKLGALLDMQERVLSKQAEAAFNQAFTAMSLELPEIRKNKDVVIRDKKQYSYATWDSIHSIINPILQKYGFSLSYDTTPRAGEDGGLIVTGTLLHRAGHKRTASVPMALENSGSKNNVQGIGSSFSYGKRYTTTMLLNLRVVDDDDDGVAAGIHYISSEQKHQLITLIQETKTDTVNFLRYFGIESVDEMQAAAFVPAFNMLQAKQRKPGPGQ
jgi:hypothetical protein